MAQKSGAGPHNYGRFATTLKIKAVCADREGQGGEETRRETRRDKREENIKKKKEKRGTSVFVAFGTLSLLCYRVKLR